MSAFEVRVARLKTGEDIICQMREPNIRDEKEEKLDHTLYRDTWIMKNAQVMILQNAGEGKMGFSFIPFFPFTKKSTELKVPKSYVVLNEEPEAELLSNYNRFFGSGIVIAPAGSVPPPDANGNVSGNIRIM